MLRKSILLFGISFGEVFFLVISNTGHFSFGGILESGAIPVSDFFVEKVNFFSVLLVEVTQSTLSLFHQDANE